MEGGHKVINVIHNARFRHRAIGRGYLFGRRRTTLYAGKALGQFDPYSLLLENYHAHKEMVNAQTRILAALVGLGREGGMYNVCESLHEFGADYQAAFDLAIKMQNDDWIKIIYCSLPANIINVELTLKGRHEFERRTQAPK